MDSFGEFLKRERELKEITLEEIRDSTKINLRFLNYLETNKFDMLPGKFFTRGIIRSYANYIGLDVSDVLNRYDEFCRKQDSPLEEEDKGDSRADERTKPSSRTKIIIWTSMIIILILISIIFIYTFGKKEPQVSQIAILEETEVPEIKEKILPDIEPDRMESGLKLEFSVDQETWFQIYADGELSFEGLKDIAETFQVNAQNEIILHVGNAGGFTFSINGKEGKPLGSPGEVIRNIVINMENYNNYIQNEQDEALPFSEFR